MSQPTPGREEGRLAADGEVTRPIAGDVHAEGHERTPAPGMRLDAGPAGDVTSEVGCLNRTPADSTGGPAIASVRHTMGTTWANIDAEPSRAARRREPARSRRIPLTARSPTTGRRASTFATPARSHAEIKNAPVVPTTARSAFLVPRHDEEAVGIEAVQGVRQRTGPRRPIGRGRDVHRDFVPDRPSRCLSGHRSRLRLRAVTSAQERPREGAAFEQQLVERARRRRRRSPAGRSSRPGSRRTRPTSASTP